ncbi:CsbD family protein [Ramlibacter sp.]|uniref:CsbD family protein n=1 Tax=Ramlibacter sp. TaxID=1917967 RepID=UPI002FCB44FC
MKKDQVKGKLKEAAGETQEQAGRLRGDREQEARGHAREQEGKVQKKVGDLKEGVDQIVRKP